jgi:hypothetical protein
MIIGGSGEPAAQRLRPLIEDDGGCFAAAAINAKDKRLCHGGLDG